MSLLVDAPKKRTFSQPVPLGRKRRKAKTFCFCDGADEGRMIYCESCKGWFHFECLEQLGKGLELDENGKVPRGFKFDCPKCELKHQRRKLNFFHFIIPNFPIDKSSHELDDFSSAPGGRH